MPNTHLSTSTLPAHTLGELAFNSGSLSELIDAINQWSTARIVSTKGEENKPFTDGLCIAYINPHVYNQSRSELAVKLFINQCDLICIDGLGTALALRARYRCSNAHPVHRVVALNLFDALHTGLDRPARAIMIGVDLATVRLSADAINDMNAAFQIVDVSDGFQDDAHNSAFLAQHHDIPWVLIGAGTPRSESIAMQARRLCPRAIVFHMGAGSIKVYAGSKRRAPDWVSRYGLEWAHRMIFEPHTRSRYTLGGWQFFKSLIKHRHHRSAP